MLVLSRRPEEQIVLPDVGVSIDVLSVRRNAVKIGVQAPVDIRVIRGELEGRQPAGGRNARKVHVLSRDEFHSLKNQLNTINLALQLLRKQREAGLNVEAEATLDRLLGEFNQMQTGLFAHPQSDPEESPEPTALLVEDDANERELLAGLLRMSGYQVATAEDGLAALEYLENEETPDVVLLDMRMPRCDGPTTLESIRSNPKLANLCVFAVSATEPAELGVPTGDGGIDGWFAKPLNPEILAKEIAQAAGASTPA